MLLFLNHSENIPLLPVWSGRQLKNQSLKKKIKKKGVFPEFKRRCAEPLSRTNNSFLTAFFMDFRPVCLEWLQELQMVNFTHSTQIIIDYA